MIDYRRVGFSGSSLGLTLVQEAGLEYAFHSIWQLAGRRVELHHGDCVEADATAHDLARKLDWRIVVHPGCGEGGSTPWRAFKQGDEERPLRPYLARNVDIVRETARLIVTPATETEVRRSGTWATIRYARSLKRPVAMILPSGSVMYENNGPDMPVQGALL